MQGEEEEGNVADELERGRFGAPRPQSTQNRAHLQKIQPHAVKKP